MRLSHLIPLRKRLRRDESALSADEHVAAAAEKRAEIRSLPALTISQRLSVKFPTQRGWLFDAAKRMGFKTAMTMMTDIKADGMSADSLIVGESRGMDELRRLVRHVAPTNASVIVTGPSGAGKEVVARAIHAESVRAAKSYVAVNCGAIPRDLLESELFGHEKGSFTGAVTQRRGRFEDAHGGTLFLDEIGDMPADMQVKLLRVLEERSIQRVGGRGQIAVDTRIVSATHRDLDQAITDQRFREDLFYRLSVFPIDLPPLSHRREDVPLLVKHFLRTIADKKRTVRFTQAAMDKLVAHDWPGNVRELRNVVERATILFPGDMVGAEQIDLILHRRGRTTVAERAALWEATELAAPIILPTPANEPQPAAGGGPLLGDGPIDLKSMVAEFERDFIGEALRLSSGVVADAARMLTLQRTTLIEKMRKYELSAKAA
ncbi:sigma-54 interaction domain-containing protein [Allosphingosinicella indica]|uniref:Sigma-54 specific transcriptional regulator, flagellar regulatory protein A n=1 Tax=Allosphingosinicella indica TaxID=941907 RepID=A0A1X7GQH2_9SPHN|nr:sigma-54 dependent transcriptional regulator [Allosphingosinicella indica]SMF72714.1 sigma-54 specific transcriptional regulator, flagellar regulatory protein A [Allosphingosinicella indica]